MTGETELSERSILMPRFTIRTLLAICTICAVASVIIGTAFRGQYWAWGVTIGLFSLVITAVTHAAWFGILWLFAQVPARHPALFPSVAPAPFDSRRETTAPSDELADTPAQSSVDA